MWCCSEIFCNIWQKYCDNIAITMKDWKYFWHVSAIFCPMWVVWCKSVKNLSNLIRVNPRLWTWMNPKNFWILMNPRSELFGLIRIENSVWIVLTLYAFGLRTSFGLIRFGSLWLNRIKFWLGFKISDLDGLIFNRFTSNEIENFFRIKSDEFGLARIQISEWTGINLIGSEWISIRNFYQGITRSNTF